MDNQFDYELREFGFGTISDGQAHDLAELHAAMLAHSPLVLMGPRFVEEFYYGLLPSARLISGAVAYVDNQPAGFIVATDDPNGFMSTAVRRFWLRLAWIVLKSLVASPARLLAMKEAYQIQSNVQDVGYGPEVGELLSFGVLPDYRSRKFIKNSSLHIATDLLNIAVRQLHDAGKTRFRAIVDKDNLEAQLFYRSSGWSVGLKSVKGWRVPTMEFLLERD